MKRGKENRRKLSSGLPETAVPSGRKGQPRSFVLRRRRLLGAGLIVLALCMVMLVAACFFGSAGYSFAKTAQVLFEGILGRSAQEDPAHTIILKIRLPRAVLAFVVGAALSAAGACMQGVFKNPMADPGILGVSAGAALGASIALVLDWNQSIFGMGAVTLCAFLCSVATVLAVYQLARRKGRLSTLSLLLAGTAASALLSALMNALMTLNHDKLENIVAWTMGSFGAASWQKLLWCLPPAAVGCAVCLLFSRDLNILLMGDDEARSLGVNVGRTRLIVIAAATLATAAAVSCCGIIGFVGLMVPHAMRMITGPDHRVLLPFSMAAGGCYLMGMDTLARTVLSPMELPVGVLTAIVGGPFFLYLLRKKR